MAAHVRGDARRSRRAGAVVFDYGNNLRAQALEAGVADAFDYPGFVPGLHPAAVLRGQRPVPLGGALGRPGGHPRDRPGDPRALPGRRGARTLDRRWPQERVAVPGPAGADLLAGLRRAREGRARVQRARAHAARSARRSSSGATTSTAARSPRRTARPRRCGRLRRRRRLAAPQRAGQHRRRRHLGLASTTAAASGIGYSQHAGQVIVADGTDARGRRAGARAHHRPGDGRPAPRRRRLRARRSRSPASAASASRCWTIRDLTASPGRGLDRAVAATRDAHRVRPELLRGPPARRRRPARGAIAARPASTSSTGRATPPTTAPS